MPIKSNFLSNNIVKTFNLSFNILQYSKILKQFFNQGKGMQVTPPFFKNQIFIFGSVFCARVSF